MRAQRAAAGLVAILIVVGLIAHAQTPQPVFKSAAIHVRVDVIATDKNDKPVTDLTAADFEIKQNSVVQTLADFEHVSIPAIDRKIDLKAPQPPPVDTFTNAPPPPNARVFVFVMWNLSPSNIVPIKRMMTSFVSALQPEDEVAIVYKSRSDLSQDFTNDSGKLVRAVNNLKASMAGPGDWFFTMHNVMQSLKGARETRKIIVFISEGFLIKFPLPAEFLDFFKESTRLNIPWYTMDARGLMAPPLGLEGHLEDQVPNGLERIRGLQADKPGMQILAENTNGRAFVNDWNVPQAAASLIGDNNSYYVLGFYPSPYEADGKFHDFEVKVKRPGVKVRARETYQSEAPPAANAKPPQLVDNLGAGLPGGELLLQATAAALSPSAKGVNTLLTMDVNYPIGASGHDQLDLAWIAIDPDGKPRASGQNSVSVDLLGKSPHVTIHDALDLPRGLLTIRATLASHVTKTNGTVHVPIEVRDLTKKRTEVAALVLTRLPAPPTQPLEIGSGLRLTPITPTTARIFMTRERLRILARVFAGNAAQVVGEMSLALPNGDTRRVPTTRSDAKAVANASDYVGDLALKDLPAGKYVLTFSARNPASDDKPAVRAATFEVK